MWHNKPSQLHVASCCTHAGCRYLAIDTFIPQDDLEFVAETYKESSRESPVQVLERWSVSEQAAMWHVST
jgi:hypothetical protein